MSVHRAVTTRWVRPGDGRSLFIEATLQSTAMADSISGPATDSCRAPVRAARRCPGATARIVDSRGLATGRRSCRAGTCARWRRTCSTPRCGGCPSPVTAGRATERGIRSGRQPSATAISWTSSTRSTRQGVEVYGRLSPRLLIALTRAVVVPQLSAYLRSLDPFADADVRRQLGGRAAVGQLVRHRPGADRALAPSTANPLARSAGPAS